MTCMEKNCSETVYHVIKCFTL